MKNYAGHPDPDEFLRAELEAAGITVHKFDFLKDGKREVNTSIMGEVHGWSFKRAWYYWVAEGPGLPPSYATALHATHGKVVRVEGHCGCPSPLEYRKGFGVGMYHIDTPDGLKALADMLKRCAAEAGSAPAPSIADKDLGDLDTFVSKLMEMMDWTGSGSYADGLADKEDKLSEWQRIRATLGSQGEGR